MDGRRRRVRLGVPRRLEDLARKDRVKLAEYTRKHYTRVFTDLTIAMLPAGAP